MSCVLIESRNIDIILTQIFYSLETCQRWLEVAQGGEQKLTEGWMIPSFILAWRHEQRYMYGRSWTGFKWVGWVRQWDWVWEKSYAVPHPYLKIVNHILCQPLPIEATIIVLVQDTLQQSCDCGSKEFHSAIVLLWRLFYNTGFQMKSNIIKAICHTNIQIYIYIFLKLNGSSHPFKGYWHICRLWLFMLSYQEICSILVSL